MSWRTISFLLNASQVFPCDPGPSGLTSRVLRSNLLSKWKNAISTKDQLHVSPKVSRKTSICSFCCNSLEGSSHIKVKPKKKMSKRMRRLERKFYYLSGSDNFTNYEKLLWRKYEANAGNALILTCTTCLSKTSIPMSKPIALKNPEEDVTSEQPARNKKKKRKAKDRLAGLKLSAVTNTNTSIVGSKTKVESQEDVINKRQPKEMKNIITHDTITINSETKSKNLSQPRTGSVQTLNKHAPDASRKAPVALKKFKKCNKLSEILAKSNNMPRPARTTRPSNKKLKPMSNLNSVLRLMLRKPNS